MTLHPVFFLDRKSRPALVFRGASGSPSYRATLVCCTDFCARFVLGPRYEDCVVVLCTGSTPVACPKNDSVTFDVCWDCAGVDCFTPRRAGRPNPPVLLAKGRGIRESVPAGTTVPNCFSPTMSDPVGGTPEQFGFLLRPGPPSTPLAGTGGTYSGVFENDPFVVFRRTFDPDTGLFVMRPFTEYRFRAGVEVCGRQLAGSVACRANPYFCGDVPGVPPIPAYCFGGGNSVTGIHGQDYAITLFQTDPYRLVFTTPITSSLGQFQWDVTEEGVQTYAPECPSPPVNPVSGGNAPAILVQDRGAFLSPNFFPAVAAGHPLRLTGPGGVNVTAPFLWGAGAYGGLGRASFAVTDPLLGPITVGFADRVGAYAPNGPYTQTVWTLDDVPTTWGAREIRPALTATAAFRLDIVGGFVVGLIQDAPFAATFQDSEGRSWEVTSA